MQIIGAILILLLFFGCQEDKSSTTTLTYESGKNRGQEEKSSTTTLTYENGKNRGIGEMSDTLKIGEWVFWYENGIVRDTSNWTNDTLDGVFVSFHNNGRKEVKHNTLIVEAEDEESAKEIVLYQYENSQFLKINEIKKIWNYK